MGRRDARIGSKPWMAVGAFRNWLFDDRLASWICIAVVAPFAALGFVTYHGMPFEQLVRVWVKHYILCPKRIVFRLENDFYNRDKMRIEAAEKKEATSDE